MFALIGWGTDPHMDTGGTMRRPGEWGLSQTLPPLPESRFGEICFRDDEKISSG